MVLRKGLAGSIMNALVTGFETGLALRDGSSVSVSNTVLFDNAVPLGSIDSQSWFLEEQTGNSVDGPAGFCDCWAALPVPFFKKAPEGGEPTGFPVDDASYRGAFADASVEANWMNAPWVNFADD